MHTPTIRQSTRKIIIGKRIKSSVANDKTMELWRSFMPRRNDIQHKVSADLFSMQVYPVNFDFQNFDVTAEFEKRAGVEVSIVDEVPDEMETFILEEGLYAVFNYIGNPNEAASFYQYVFTRWLPSSGYEVDDRVHFEILGEKYKNNDPNSEEEVWIPIRTKQ